tara:strand:- start:64 stop:816 length:753 start_codon:yes stop_codon:yes gene_type:complete
MITSIYNFILIPWLLLAIISFFFLFWINAPYGRFSDKNWGILVDYKIGWFVQEIISPLTFSYFFINGVAEKNIISWILFSIWVIHYINRSIIFPMRICSTSKIPISVIASAIFFNLVNGFINGYYIGNIINFPITYLYSMKFILGFIILIIGVIINTSADKVLIKIKNQNIGYQIPTGGLYKYITCPNYFGEIIQWTGFAIITWSFPALLFVLWTMANLIPRAKAYNNWYQLRFKGEYPNNKKAIIPYII